MKQRAVEDRRIKKIKVEHNRRLNPRRAEDVSNINAYYFSLYTGIIILAILAIISIKGA